MFSKRMKQLIASVLTITMLGTIAPAGAFAATPAGTEDEGWVNGFVPNTELDANGIPVDAVMTSHSDVHYIPAPEDIEGVDAIEAMRNRYEAAKSSATGDWETEGTGVLFTDAVVYSEEALQKMRDANEAISITAATTASELGFAIKGKHYVFEEDVTITPHDGNRNGISLQEGITTILEIKQGVTVTVTGQNGDSENLGGAGIYVPESSTLVVMGPGTLIATGGNAGNGANGQDAKPRLAGQAGGGGNGGNGGGGAGAGIGGHGAAPAKGGEGGFYALLDGDPGKNGEDSNEKNECGEIYFLNHANVIAKAGAKGTTDGVAGQPGEASEGMEENYYCGGGGAGGGGTAGLAPICGIGYGGISGAAGGGGGSGTRSSEQVSAAILNGQNGANADATVAVNPDRKGGKGGDGGTTGKVDPEKATGRICASFDSTIEGREEGDIERGNYVVDENGKLRDVFAETITDLETFHPEDGKVYRFTTVMTRRANATESALEIPEHAKVVLEISNTADVTFIGGDADGREGAGAGIRVPESSTLVIIGNGKLTAIGGNGADAKDYSGGAGAGIGGTGGSGGTGAVVGQLATPGTGCGTVYISGPLELNAVAGKAGGDMTSQLGGRAPDYGIGGGGAGGWTLGHDHQAINGNNGNVYIDYGCTHVTGRTHYVHNANISLDIMGNVILGGYTDMIHGYFDANVKEEVLYQAILQVANHNGLKKGEGWKVLYPNSDDPDNNRRDDNAKFETNDFSNGAYRIGNEWHKDIVDMSGGYIYLFATILGRYARDQQVDKDNPRDLGNRCWNNLKAYATKNNLYLTEDMHTLFNEILFYEHYGEPFGGKRASLYIDSNPTSGRHRHASDALQQIDFSFATVLDRDTARCATISYDTQRKGKLHLFDWYYWYYQMNNSTYKCTDGYVGVSTENWMKSIPGTASLVEVNMPGTHDAGTAHVSINTEVVGAAGGLFTKNLDIVFAALEIFGLAELIPGISALVTTLTVAAAVFLAVRLPSFFPYLAESMASCQSMSIGEQLQAGIRTMDIRVAYNRDRKNRLSEYTGEQQFEYALSMLKISHGTLGDAPKTIKELKPYDVTLTDAFNGKGDNLTLAEVIGDCKHFLKEHDTESVVLLFQKEGNLDENKADSEYMQAYNVIFNWLEQNKNNKDNHIFALKEGDPIPSMDQARGNIYIIHSSQYSKYEDHYDVSADSKKEYVKKVLDEATAIPGKYKGIPQDFTRQHVLEKQSDGKIGFPKVIFTSTYHLDFHVAEFLAFSDCISGTPKQIAKTVNNLLDTYGFRRGMHYGWLMMNNPTGMAISNIYFSNIFNTRASLNGIKPGETGYQPDPTPDPEPYYGGGGGEQQGIIVTPTDNTETTIQNNVSADVLNKAETAAAQDSTLTMIGGNDTAVNVSAKDASGNTLTGFIDPLVVSIPLTAAEVAKAGDTSKLTIAKVNVDANGNVSFTYMGGSYDATTGRVTGFVDEPGNYVVLEDSDITKLELQINNPTYKDNDVAKHTDVAPIIEESRTLVPLRLVAENLGCNVDWDEMTRTVTIEKDGVVMTMTIDEVIEGFDVAPIIYEDRTMVPIRYIAERLKANVIWVPKTQQIVIVK